MKFTKEYVTFMEKHVFVQNAYKWVKMLKEFQNSIQDEDKPDKSTIVSTSEMVDSIRVPNLSDRRVTTEDIY